LRSNIVAKEKNKIVKETTKQLFNIITLTELSHTMDDTTWIQLEAVKQLIMLFESFKSSRMMQMEVVARRPDSVGNVLVYHRQVPLMPNDFSRHYNICTPGHCFCDP
jgi:hypothetical protein